MTINPSTFQARAMVKALAKHGVDTVVIAPGSRNGALSIALAQAERHFTVLTRIDERTAAFTALGVAKRTTKPVAVLCTSGTAAAHFTAAAFEAREAGVPLILLTADRPDSVRGRGANQTIEQVGMFSNAVIAEWDLPVAQDHDELYWELAVANAVSASLGDEYSAPGPVHLNIPFAEPLVPEDADLLWINEIVNGPLPTPHRLPDIELLELMRDMGITTDSPRGVIIISDPYSASDAIALATHLRWPVLAEPGSMARVPSVGVAHYAKILKENSKELASDIVITAGRFGLSRAVAQYVKDAQHHIAVGRYPLDADPFDTASHHIARMPIFNGVLPADEQWLVQWQTLDNSFSEVDSKFTARTAVKTFFATTTARDLVWVSASNSVRIVDDVAPLRADAPMMLVNRGTNGIDGLIASATGAAIKHSGRTYLLIGDVAFLHDISSLALPSSETWPNLTVVVINNNGGEIFRSLEQGDAKFASVFDKVYSTPHGKSPAAIAGALGFSSEKVSSISELENALASQVHVIEVVVN